MSEESDDRTWELLELLFKPPGTAWPSGPTRRAW
jgi:hypothetical protein